jgi:hypothetical protein
MNDTGTSTAFTAESEAAAITHAGLQAFARAAALTVRLALEGSSAASRAFIIGVSDAITTAPRFEYLANATIAEESFRELAAQLETHFRNWQELRFEDGVENDVSRQLWLLLITHSSLLIEALASVITAEKTSARVAAEALRHLGRFVHPSSHTERLWLLAHALRSSSPLSRDGASLGLAHLEDPSAIPYLKAAIESEPDQSLKQDLQQVLDGLQQTKDAAAGKTR